MTLVRPDRKSTRLNSSGLNIIAANDLSDAAEKIVGAVKGAA